MKKAILALCVVMLISGSAFAVSISSGTYSSSITDRSNVYSVPVGGDPDYALPEGIGDDVDIGDEQRTVITIDSIAFGAVDINPISGDTKITETGPFITYTASNLKGMLYDINVSGFSNGAPAVGNTTDIFKAPGARYTSFGGSDGTWTDMSSSLIGLVTSAGGYGGILIIYEDPTPGIPAKVFDAGPGAWLEPGQPGHVASAIPGVMTDSDFYPGISDQGTPWLVAVLTPLPISAYN